MASAHLFALYLKHFSEQKPLAHSPFVISDEMVMHRMVHVLRMQVGDMCTLFDRQIHATATIRTIEKKRIVVNLQEVVPNKKSATKITVLLPMLKKDAFEDALYALVECGIDSVVVVTTEKSQRKYAEHDLARIEKILIAASEQSKHYLFPEITKPEPLEVVVNRYNGLGYRNICAHPEGKAFSDFAKTVTGSIDKEYVLIVGPEGDFSAKELQMLSEHSFELVALTPTILRSFQAVFLLAGAVRSLAHR